MTESLLSKAKPAHDFLADTFRWKVLLCGPTGSGKSTLATTLPGKKLFIDLDDRAASLAGSGDIDVITITESAEVEKPQAYRTLYGLVDEIWEAHDRDELIYDSIVVDGLTSLGRFAMNEALVWQNQRGEVMSRGPGDAPAQPHYSAQMAMFARIINRIRPLKRHICFTAHYDLYEDKELHTLTYWPKVYGNLRTEIASWFNESYETKAPTMKSGKPEYLINTFGSGRFGFVKSALNQLGKYWGNPVKIDFSDEPVGFARLMAYRTGELKWEGGLESKAQKTTIKI